MFKTIIDAFKLVREGRPRDLSKVKVHIQDDGQGGLSKVTEAPDGSVFVEELEWYEDDTGKIVTRVVPGSGYFYE